MIDEGDIVTISKYAFPENCKSPNDYALYTSKKSIELIKKFISEVIEGKEFHPSSQKNEASSYWPRLNTEIQGFIDWDWDAKFIKKFIDAFDNPYKGSRTFLKEREVILKKATFSESDEFHPFQRGLIFRKHQGKVYIACINGELVIEEITDNDDNPIFDDVRLGDRLHTPKEFLEKALN